jgi:hypothetical protein
MSVNQYNQNTLHAADKKKTPDSTAYLSQGNKEHELDEKGLTRWDAHIRVPLLQSPNDFSNGLRLPRRGAGARLYD